MEEKVVFDWNPDGMNMVHYVGDAECGACWSPPTPCDCGGLIHKEFGDENYDSYWLYRKCDKCGES